MVLTLDSKPCSVMHMPKPNRFRKQIATTIHPDILNAITALSSSDKKGLFIDEAVHAYITSCYWFSYPDGGLQLRHHGSYHFVDYNDEQQSPEFMTITEALIWLRDTYPDSNSINLPKDTGVKLL